MKPDPTQALLHQARQIWGSDPMLLDQIVVAMGTVYGDICRYARDKNEGRSVEQDNLKKELGNIIFSTIRWSDDLGFSPDECIELARQAQKTYVMKKESVDE